MKAPEEKCGNCKFFKSINQAGKPGYCRKSPPVYIAKGAYSTFPGVNKELWCGEYRSKVIYGD